MGLDLDRLRSIGQLKSRTLVREGREHPETGRPYKAVTDEAGNTVTEHSGDGPAPGVSGRQDVHINAPVVTATTRQ